MSIRVGKRTYRGAHTTESPVPPGYKKIVVMIRDDIAKDEFGGLSPYNIKDDNGVIIENKWQFSKVYKKVAAVKMPYSTHNPKIVWEHPAEVHIDAAGNLTPEYFAWRAKGFASHEPIRFPAGMSMAARSSCQYSLASKEDGSVDPAQKLDYVAGRKQIYCKEYCSSVKKHPQFKMLKDMLDAEQNLIIIEVDGPHQESLNHYKQTYGVGDDFIVNESIDVTVPNMQIMINDTKHAFGHGYCLAMELLGITDTVCDA
jgi:hypothetical protein